MYMSATSSVEPEGVLRQPSHEQIAGMAYWLYVEQGSYPGHDLDDWFRAEQLLTLQLNELPAPSASDLEQTDEPHTNGAWRADGDVDPIADVDRIEYPLTLEERATSDLRELRPRITSYRPATRESRFTAPASNEANGRRANPESSLELLHD